VPNVTVTVNATIPAIVSIVSGGADPVVIDVPSGALGNSNVVFTATIVSAAAIASGQAQDPQTTAPSGTVASTVSFFMSVEGSQSFATAAPIRVKVPVPHNLVTPGFVPAVYLYDVAAAQWKDAADTCPERNVVIDVDSISLDICHFTQFALFSVPSPAPSGSKDVAGPVVGAVFGFIGLVLLVGAAIYFYHRSQIRSKLQAGSDPTIVVGGSEMSAIHTSLPSAQLTGTGYAMIGQEARPAAEPVAPAVPPMPSATLLPQSSTADATEGATTTGEP